jgi:Overcoming lysogenization defect protein-like, TOPRIM domain
MRDAFDDHFDSTVVLVEGASDRKAVAVLAERLGRNLGEEGVTIVSMEGATNIGRFLRRFGPDGENVTVAGLCDAREEGAFRKALETFGFGAARARADMETLGFFVCEADLEDELIRAVGAASVEEVLDAQGELAAFRTFQRQPAWRGRGQEAQLRRFMGTHGGRKERYAALLVEAMDLRRIPRPLAGLISSV